MTTVESALVDILPITGSSLAPSRSSSIRIDRARNIRLAADRVCKDILPEAIALTDAFGWTDWELDR